jgi:membrane protein DedA with SNARE-associated domain
MIEAQIQWILHHGYAGLFALLVLGIFGAPFPDEILLTFTGYLVSKGDLDFTKIVLVTFAGCICGISLSYSLGRLLGVSVLKKYGRLLRVDDTKLAKIHNWFEKNGKWSLLIGYYVVGVRHIIAIVAGASKLDLLSFAIFAYTGGLIWSATFISLGYFFGEEWQWISEKIRQSLTIGTIMIMILLVLYLLIKKRKMIMLKRYNDRT